MYKKQQGRKNFRPAQHFQNQSQSSGSVPWFHAQGQNGQGPRQPASQSHANQPTANGQGSNNNSTPKPKMPRKPREKPAGPPLPPFRWFTSFPQARLIYLNTPAKAIDFLSTFSHDLLFSGKEPIIGFDMEWKPNFVKGHTENPVALIQLASTDAIALLHISSWNWSSPNTFTALEKLTSILHDGRIKKLGVSIKDDGRKLYRDTRLDLYGCIDLSELAHLVDPEPWRPGDLIGLARLCANYVGLDLDKKKKVSRSNWELLPLNEEQMLYAANDAAVAIAIYTKIKQLINPASPPNIWECEFNVIEGAHRNLTHVAREAAAISALSYLPSPPPPQPHHQPEIVSAYTLFVVD